MDGLFGVLPVALLGVAFWLILRYGRRQRLKTPARPVSVPVDGPLVEPEAKAVSLKGDGAFGLRVVGLAYRRDTLVALFKRTIAEASDGEDAADLEGASEQVEVRATLKLVSDNQHDPNAVEVRLRGRLVGYLPAKLAPAFRKYVQQRHPNRETFTCAAVVDVPLDSGDFEVELDLPRLMQRP